MKMLTQRELKSLFFGKQPYEDAALEIIAKLYHGRRRVSVKEIISYFIDVIDSTRFPWNKPGVDNTMPREYKGDHVNIKCPHCNRVNNYVTQGVAVPFREIKVFVKPCFYCKRDIEYHAEWEIRVTSMARFLTEKAEKIETEKVV